MYKLPSKSQYHVGNDKAIPDSAFVASSWCDGIYTQFDADNAPNGWADVQDTFKMNLPQDKWQLEDERAAASGFATSALFTDGYGTATTGKVLDQFPELFTSGRSDYVGIEQSAE